MTQEEMKSVSYTSNVLKVSLMPIDSGLRDVIVQAAGGDNTYSARQANDLHNYHFILLERFFGILFLIPLYFYYVWTRLNSVSVGMVSEQL